MKQEAKKPSSVTIPVHNEAKDRGYTYCPNCRLGVFHFWKHCPCCGEVNEYFSPKYEPIQLLYVSEDCKEGHLNMLHELRGPVPTQVEDLKRDARLIYCPNCALLLTPVN